MSDSAEFAHLRRCPCGRYTTVMARKRGHVGCAAKTAAELFARGEEMLHDWRAVAEERGRAAFEAAVAEPQTSVEPLGWLWGSTL
jgi:hypothetical protein